MQYAELADFLSRSGFGSPPSFSATVEQRLAPVSLQEGRAIVAQVLSVCKRLTNADADTQELATSTFET